MLNKIILLLICILSVINSFGQTKIGLNLGQASDNKYTQSEPAKFVGTFPSNDTVKNSYLINGYLGLDISFNNSLNRELLKLSIIAEEQKNTLIAKEQHVEQLGIKLSRVFVLSKEVNGIQDVQKFLLTSELSGKYSNDKIKKKEGTQIIFSNSFSVPIVFEGSNKWKNIFRPYVIWPSDNVDSISLKSVGVSKWIQYKHIHNFGIEYISYESLTMANISFGIEIYPFSGLLYNLTKKYSLVQFKWNYTNRIDISNSNSSFYVGPIFSIGFALNYKFDTDGKSSISIGYEYIDGGNPMKGLDNQKYGQFTLAAKMNIK